MGNSGGRTTQIISGRRGGVEDREFGIGGNAKLFPVRYSPFPTASRKHLSPPYRFERILVVLDDRLLPFAPRNRNHVKSGASLQHPARLQPCQRRSRQLLLL